jgi:hypothetical protein
LLRFLFLSREVSPPRVTRRVTSARGQCVVEQGSASPATSHGFEPRALPPIAHRVSSLPTRHQPRRRCRRGSESRLDHVMWGWATTARTAIGDPPPGLVLFRSLLWSCESSHRPLQPRAVHLLGPRSWREDLRFPGRPLPTLAEGTRDTRKMNHRVFGE